MKHKPRNYTFDQYLTKIFCLYLAYKEENPFLLDVAEKSCIRIDEYVKIISNCPNCSPKLEELNRRPIDQTTFRRQSSVSAFNLEGEFKTIENW